MSAAAGATVKGLGDALDHAEATIPALDRMRSRTRQSITGPMAAYGRNYYTPGESYGLHWVLPRHPSVLAYWRQLKSNIVIPPVIEDDLRTCRKRFKEAREIYENKTLYRSRAVHAEEVSLRAILDARAVMVAAFMALEQVEGHAKYWRQIRANKLAADRDAKLRRRNPQARVQRRRAWERSP